MRKIGEWLRPDRSIGKEVGHIKSAHYRDWAPALYKIQQVTDPDRFTLLENLSLHTELDNSDKKIHLYRGQMAVILSGVDVKSNEQVSLIHRVEPARIREYGREYSRDITQSVYEITGSFKALTGSPREAAIIGGYKGRSLEGLVYGFPPRNFMGEYTQAKKAILQGLKQANNEGIRDAQGQPRDDFFPIQLLTEPQADFQRLRVFYVTQERLAVIIYEKE